MRTVTLARTMLRVALAVSILGGVSGAVAEEEDPWQQEEAARLSKQLADQVGDLRLTMKQAIPGTVGTTRKNRFRLEEDIRMIRNAAKHLAAQLEAGKGRDETLPTAQNIGMFIRAARADAAGWVPPEWIETKLDAARGTLEKLVPLYGATMEDVYRQTPGPSVGASP